MNILLSISNNLFDHLSLSPIEPLDEVTYSTDKRYLCVVNGEELKEIQKRCTLPENINTQLGNGRYLYRIINHGKENVWYTLEVHIYDIYEPNVVRWFNLDWRSPLYLRNATDKILEWIDDLHREADRWIPM